MTCILMCTSGFYPESQKCQPATSISAATLTTPPISSKSVQTTHKSNNFPILKQQILHNPNSEQAKNNTSYTATSNSFIVLSKLQHPDEKLVGDFPKMGFFLRQ
ncbi:hypothetical protein Drorol1_Dr00005559 [Drosera rotundifolia]